jgi:hypothetical protein
LVKEILVDLDMIPRISEIGKFFLRNRQAGEALVNALATHSNKFHKGEAIPFTILIQEGNEVKEKTVFVQKVTALLK